MKNKNIKNHALRKEKRMKEGDFIKKNTKQTYYQIKSGLGIKREMQHNDMKPY